MSRTIKPNYNFKVGKPIAGREEPLGACALVPTEFYESGFVATPDLTGPLGPGLQWLDHNLFGNMWCSGATFHSDPGRQNEPDHTFSTGDSRIDNPQHDIIRTKCFLGEKAKRTGTKFSDDKQQLCAGDNSYMTSIASVLGETIGDINKSLPFGRVGYPVQDIHCSDTLSGENCSTYKPDPPEGWVHHETINSQDSSYCDLNLREAGTNVQVDGSKACRYGYVKDWDTQIGNNNIDNHLSGVNKNVPGTYWGYPRYFPAYPGGEIPQYLVDTESGYRHTDTYPYYTYNENKIPIKRMECCLQKKIILDETEVASAAWIATQLDPTAAAAGPEDPAAAPCASGSCWNNTLSFKTSDGFNQEDIDKCPIDKNKLNQITVTEGGATDGSDISDNAINAYTQSSLMCGATNDNQGTFSEEKRGTPPYWCSYNILNGTDEHPNPTAERESSTPIDFYGHHFDIINFDRYWSLLNDNLCNAWTNLDGTVASAGGGDTAEYRKSNLAQYLAPFYLWISNDLAHNTPLKPTNTNTEAIGLDDTRNDLITPDPGSPDSHCVSNTPCFDISDDYGKYMNILSHTRAAEFLKYASDPDRREFNKNMVTFCNRSDIFNFKDYIIEGNRHYNSRLEDRYNKLCSCYWDKNNDNTPPDQFDKIHAAIINFFETEQTATSGQMIASYRDNLQLDLANQCWFNNCIANDHFGSPYKPGTQSDEPTVPSPDGCPDQCVAIAQATCILNNQGTIEAGDINFDCQAESDCSSGSSLPNPMVHTVSDMDDLLTISHGGSVDVGESGGSPGNTPGDSPRGSIDNKKIFFLLSILIILIGIILFY